MPRQVEEDQSLVDALSFCEAVYVFLRSVRILLCKIADWLSVIVRHQGVVLRSIPSELGFGLATLPLAEVVLPSEIEPTTSAPLTTLEPIVYFFMPTLDAAFSSSGSVYDQAREEEAKRP